MIGAEGDIVPELGDDGEDRGNVPDPVFELWLHLKISAYLCAFTHTSDKYGSGVHFSLNNT